MSLSVLPFLLPVLPRTACGACPRDQIATLAITALFTAAMVLLGQPIAVAAGVASSLVAVAAWSVRGGPAATVFPPRTAGGLR